MLKVRVSGNTGDGKTSALVDMVCNMAERGCKVLFVSPSHKRAMQIQLLSNVSGRIMFSGPKLANFRFRDWDCIFIDDLHDFPDSKEGGWLSLAESRLIHKQGGFLAYSSAYFTQDPAWVSKAVWWKPWTWNRGYWK